MQATRKRSAIAKYGDQIKSNPEGAKLAMKAAANPFSDSEIEEVFGFVLNPPDQTQNNQGSGNFVEPAKVVSMITADGYNPADPNAQFRAELQDLDYENLNNENNDSFTKYQGVVSKLVSIRNYDFQQFMAFSEREKFYDKNLKVQEKIVGIKINKTTPVNTSRMPAEYAANLNAQIWNSSSGDLNSRYWLLKKD